MWVTNVIAYDMRPGHGGKVSRELLKRWWEQLLLHTTQDQVSFPFVLWKMGILVSVSYVGVHGRRGGHIFFFLECCHINVIILIYIFTFSIHSRILSLTASSKGRRTQTCGLLRSRTDSEQRTKKKYTCSVIIDFFTLYKSLELAGGYRV